jgi:hypothetical protein
MCCRSKNDFCKKSGAFLITAKVQIHPGSSEISTSLHKIQNIPLKVSATKRELLYVSQVVYYLCGVLCPAFDFAFQWPLHKKNTVLALRQWKKAISWDETKISLRGVPRHLRGHTRVQYGLFQQTMP